MSNKLQYKKVRCVDIQKRQCQSSADVLKAPHQLVLIGNSMPPKIYIKAMSSLLLAFMLAACGGGSDVQEPAVSTIQNPGQAWKREIPIYSACCNYAQVIIDSNEPSSPTHIYTNADPAVNATGLHLYAGTLEGVIYQGKVLSINAPRDAYIRTFGLAKRNGKYFALLYTGDGYPTSGGYSPSWATSDDGLKWNWAGPVSPYPRAFSSGQALTAEPDGSFRAWVDQVGGTLREMSSLDGLTWKDKGDMWPTSLPKGQALFPNATRTDKGTMLAVADAFPANKIRTLWNCHGQKNWSVVEEDAPIRNGQKGAALSWDGEKIHAYANGEHWTRNEPACEANSKQ